HNRLTRKNAKERREAPVRRDHTKRRTRESWSFRHPRYVEQVTAIRCRRAAIATVETPVAVRPTPIATGSECGLFRLRMIADAMRPGVVRIHRNTASGTTLDGNKHRVVAGCTFRSDPCNVSIFCSAVRIRQDETPALFLVGGR